VVNDDEYENDANSDFNIDISFENLKVGDENDCAQNVPIYHENIKENHARRAHARHQNPDKFQFKFPSILCHRQTSRLSMLLVNSHKLKMAATLTPGREYNRRAAII